MSIVSQRLRLLWTSGLLLAAFSSSHALPVFPGAIGYGTDTAAGRGGTVYRVENLNDDGPGSLRYGIEDVEGPRVIIFDVSGVIELESDLVIRDDSYGDFGYLTIAGQTAPAPGITLKNAGISIRSHDVLIQHLAIRPGNLLAPLDNRDAIKVEAPPGVLTRNIVIDHVTCTWAVDETVSVWSDNGSIENVTFSNSIFASPVLNAGHSKGSHGYGPLSGRNTKNVSILRNIMAFNTGRNPLVRDTTGGAQVVNNFVYRPGPWPNSAMYFGDLTVAPHAVSVIGNVIKRHPIPFTIDQTDANGVTAPVTYTTYYNTSIYVHDVVSSDAGFYLADNRVFNPQTSVWHPTDGDPWNSSIFRDSPSEPVTHLTSDPYDNSGGTTWTPWAATSVEANLLAGAGKHPAMRDYYDDALIDAIETNSGQFLEYLSDLGSDPWSPVDVQNTRVLTLPSNPNGDDDSDGYTNLEEWLHDWAAVVEGTGTPPVDPGEVYSEDFSDGQAQNWSTVAGTWNVTSGYYAQTANHYPDIAVYTGDTWQTDFTYSASLYTSWSATNNRVGLVYNYVDDDNYCYAIVNASGLVEINKVTNGGSPVVVDSATYPGGTGVLDDVWFDVDVVRSGTTTSVLVNGTAVLTNVAQAGLAAGRIGFITRFNASARFDNVYVEAASSATVLAADDFEDGNANGWDTVGTWSVVTDGSDVFRNTNLTGLSTAMIDDGPWTDQVLEVDAKALNLTSGSTRWFGVAVRYTDPDNYYYVTIRNNNQAVLKKMVNGVFSDLDSIAFTPSTNTWYSLKLSAIGNSLKFSIDGDLKLEATDSDLTSGTVGGIMYQASAQFDDVLVTDP